MAATHAVSFQFIIIIIYLLFFQVQISSFLNAVVSYIEVRVAVGDG